MTDRLALALDITADPGAAISGLQAVATAAERTEQAVAAASRASAEAQTQAVNTYAAQSTSAFRRVVAAHAASLQQMLANHRARVGQMAFQAQDIFTQLSLGAPVLQTIAMQGAQAAGAFGAIGAAIGVALIPIAAIGTALLSISGQSAQAAEQVERLSRALSETRVPAVSAAQTYDDLQRAVRSLGTELRQLTELQLLVRQQEVGRVSESLGDSIRSQISEALRELRAVDAWLQHAARLGRQLGPSEADQRVAETIARAERLRSVVTAIEELDAQFVSGARSAAEVAAQLGLILAQSEDLPAALRDRAAEMAKLGESSLRAAAALREAREALAAIRGQQVDVQAFERATGIRGQLEGRLPPAPPKPTVDRAAEAARRAAEAEERRRLEEIRRAELEALIRRSQAGEFADARDPAQRARAAAMIAEERAAAERAIAAATAERARAELALRAARGELSEAELAVEERRLELMQQGVALSSTAAAQVLEQAAATAQLERQIDALSAAQYRAQSTARMVGDAIASGFERAILYARSLSEAVGQLARDLAAVVLRATITEPLGRAISEGLSGLLGSLSSALAPAANGAVVSAGRIQPFAAGGVIQRPLFFPLRTGLGLMGEAGPEAIMPLRRTASGRLGVEVAGGAGGVVTNVSITVDARGADQGAGARVRQAAPELARAVRALARAEALRSAARG